MLKEKNSEHPLSVLISQEKIQNRVEELASTINQDYFQVFQQCNEKNPQITTICILKGSFIFFSDLIRFLKMPLNCEFLGISSYDNKMTSSGEIKLTLDVHEPLEGQHVLIFEDIVDTGLTLSYLKKTLLARKPASLKICVLLQKTLPRTLSRDSDNNSVHLSIDYVGFTIGKEFAVGYGLDFAGKYRELPYIGQISYAN